MCRKKQRSYNLAKHTHKAKHWERFSALKRNTRNAMCHSHLNNMNSILEESLKCKDSSISWRYDKSQCQDSIGVPPLKRNGQLHSGSAKKASIEDHWKNVHVSPIHKKGSRHHAENCCPISLTCICSKSLEHVVCHHIMSHHLEEHNILTHLQHGFRSGMSTVTQLLVTWNSGPRNGEWSLMPRSVRSCASAGHRSRSSTYTPLAVKSCQKSTSPQDSVPASQPPPVPPETQGAGLPGACPLCPRVRSISLGPTPEEGCKRTRGGPTPRSTLHHQQLRMHQQCYHHAEKPRLGKPPGQETGYQACPDV